MPEFLQGSFASGELSPEMLGRVDLAKYRVGATTMRNFFTLKTGGATNRAGTRCVGPVINAAQRGRLIPFVFSADQGCIIELGDRVLRVVMNAGFVIGADGVNPFTLATPWAVGDVMALNYTQSGDIMTLVHPNYPPQDLVRTGANSWTIGATAFTPGISSPSGVTATPLNANPGSYSQIGFQYVVTAIAPPNATDPDEESPGSAVATCINNTNLQGNAVNKIDWTAVSGADHYNVYKGNSGVLGFIGSTTGTEFLDTNFVPDTVLSPPIYANPFAGNNPGVVEYHQQRLVFAASNANPETIWTSQSGNRRNFDYSNPTRDSDSITATLAVKQVNQIRGIVSLNALLVLTSGAEFVAPGDQNGALTPATAVFKPQSYIGASARQPLICGGDVLYEQATGTGVRTVRYDFYSNTFQSLDLTKLATHLFLGFSIADWAWAQEPYRLVWAVRSDGVMLCLTYLREDDVFAWSHHDTYGAFESVAVVREGGVDYAYVTVSRPFGRFIERIENRLTGAQSNWFVDCALAYSGGAVTKLSGLDHLDGQTVTAVTSNGVYAGLTVAGGAVTLPVAVTSAVVGLPYESDLVTVDIEPGLLETHQGSLAKIPSVKLRLLNTSGLSASADGVAYEPVSAGDFGAETVGGPFSGFVDVLTGSTFARSTRVYLKQTMPLPVTVLDVVPKVVWPVPPSAAGGGPQAGGLRVPQLAALAGGGIAPVSL